MALVPLKTDTPESSAHAENEEGPVYVLKRHDIRPFLIKRFDFSYDEDKKQWRVDVTNIHNPSGDVCLRAMMYARGNVREKTMKENRERLLAKQPFSEFVRFVRVQYVDRNTLKEDVSKAWMGVLAIDIIFLTLNSRHRMSHEMKTTEWPRTALVLVKHGKKRQMSRVITLGAAKKYICHMNTRRKERKIIKECLLSCLFQSDFE